MPANASTADIKAAYRRLVLQYHPDHNPGPEAEARIRRINAAYEVLSQPQRRRRYDWQLFQREKHRRARQKQHQPQTGAGYTRGYEPGAGRASHASGFTADDPGFAAFAAASAQMRDARRRAAAEQANRLTWRSFIPIGGVMVIILSIIVYFFVVHKHVVIPRAKVNLGNEELSYFPQALVAQHQVRNLMLHGNRIARLPPEVGTMQGLLSLNLNNNLLTSLPPQITRLNHLEQLHLSANHFEKVPPAVFRMPQLKVLALDYNRIQYIPPELTRLWGLEVLLLNDNPIERLPEDLRGWRRLSRLDLRRTKLSVREKIRIRMQLPYTELQF